MKCKRLHKLNVSFYDTNGQEYSVILHFIADHYEGALYKLNKWIIENEFKFIDCTLGSSTNVWE